MNKINSMHKELISILGRKMVCYILGLSSTEELDKELVNSTPGPNWSGLRYAWLGVKLLQLHNDDLHIGNIFGYMSQYFEDERCIAKAFASRNKEDWFAGLEACNFWNASQY